MNTDNITAMKMRLAEIVAQKADALKNALEAADALEAAEAAGVEENIEAAQMVFDEMDTLLDEAEGGLREEECALRAALRTPEEVLRDEAAARYAQEAMEMNKKWAHKNCCSCQNK